MLLNSLIILLLSNSITSRRDKSILYSRVSITILILSAFITYDNLSLLFLAKGIGIFAGLFHTTATTNTFHVFIFLITSVILLLTSFYPRKVWLKHNSSPSRILFTKFIYYGTLITNKMGEQFKIIEYPLIILFIVTGSVFFIPEELLSLANILALLLFNLITISLITFSLITYSKVLIVLYFSLITYSKVLIALYFSEPLFLTLSDNLRMSGFYSGKGKGKAIDVAEEEKPKSPSKSETDSDYEDNTRKTIALSLQEKKGESSKSVWTKEDSPVELDFEKLIALNKDWKILHIGFLTAGKQYNKLKIKLDNKVVKSEEDLQLLSHYLKESNEFKFKKSRIEEILLKHGIDPSEQFNYEYSSSSESDFSQYSSDKTQSSNNSQTRNNKRVKFSNVNINSDFSLVFIGFNITPILRILSCITSAILLLVIHLNILPYLDMCFKIDLTQLITLYLIVNLTKLIFKWYTMIICIYNNYLNKDYMTIYFNIYFSIVITLLYFSSNINSYIFYC